MPLYYLGPELWFPSVEESLPDGLLAFGGDLSVDRLLLAYRSGIFPWYDPDELPLWYCPNPRFVLYPEELKVTKSMQQVLRSGKYEFRSDTAFAAVVEHCSTVARPGQGGTWIGNEIKEAVNALHKLGYAHSAECWAEGKLVGGLYGVRIGGVFFGESMFTLQPNASKFAFIHWVRSLAADGVKLIDSQVHTQHLESLGARMIPRTDFIALLNELL